MTTEKTLTGNMHIALALGCAVAMAISSFAAERTWIGESGSSWYVAENWDPSGIPA